jgi:aspartate/glutamate racemase
MKTIAIIGGMGPQASIFAQSQLVKELIKAKKRANIIHISLDVTSFHSIKPNLSLSRTQKELLWPYQS